MINLLPDEIKGEIKAGRANVILLRYNLLSLVAFTILAAFCLLFYVLLQSAQTHAVATSSNNTAKASTLDNVRKAADDYRSNLLIAKQILNNSVNYTSTILEITKLIPKGVVLDNINISNGIVGQQTTFGAHALTYSAATDLKHSFENSKLFSNVYFQKLNDENKEGASPKPYPIAITISAKLNQVVN